ncbi:leucine-rich repeat neuronal protein 4 isoform X2 [Siphateles boraxobius]|uniref:leucine-rich repeat neuronal protein 4 isoform X2 n=1 Tax=Siphateles boraxobius TaxID=180520 RepID=UPI004064ABD6
MRVQRRKGHVTVLGELHLNMLRLKLELELSPPDSRTASCSPSYQHATEGLRLSCVQYIMLVCLHPVILLLINFLDLSSSSSSQNDTRPRSPLNDYSDYEENTTEPTSSSTSEVPEFHPCDYDMCVEQQQTCKELAAVTPCLCPGLSPRDNPPSPPRLSHLTQQDDKGVLVHWCAPTSIITHYIVLVKGKDKVIDKEIKVQERKRAVVLRDVAAGALVCVKAVNIAGISTENGQSCATFEPQHSDSGLALKLGIIGGVVGLVVLLILALLLWRHKTLRKSTARNETGGVL